MHGAETAWLRTYTAAREERIWLGLFRVERLPLCVLDADGVVRMRHKDAFSAHVPAGEAAGRLAALVERYSAWGDGGLVIPEVHLVKPQQIVDLAGLVQPSQLTALAGAELAALAPDEGVTLLIVPRG